MQAFPTRVAAATLLLSLPLLAQTRCPSVGTVEDFETGQNPGRWSFNVTVRDEVISQGGNPGSWLRNRGIQSFAPRLTSDPKVNGLWQGDFRAKGVERISFDAITLERNIGQPATFEMSLLLRDTKGTIDPLDDDYVYQLGPDVPLIGQGWVHYDFDVPSQSTATLPAGWSGGHAGDPTAFRPGVDWSDVIQNVDRVEFWWLNPSFAAIFADWDVGVDNIEIVTDGGALAVPVVGAGTNRSLLSSLSPPRFQSLWSTQLDCSQLGPGTAVLLISASTNVGTSTRFGELLLDPATVSLFAFRGSGGTPVTFDFVLPDIPALCGLRFSMQGLCTSGRRGALTNGYQMYVGH